MGVGVPPARRSDPVLLAGALGIAIGGVELLSWSILAGGVAVVALVAGSRLLGRVAARPRVWLLVGLLAAGAVVLTALAFQPAEPARIAARALGAACLAYAGWALRARA